MNVLITGATGFIGQHLIETIDLNRYNVFLLTRDHKKEFRFKSEKYTVVKGDLNDFDSILKATQSIDCVINIAAEVRNKSQLYQTNIAGVKNLMEACGINKVSKVIHISSVGVVGKQYNMNYELVDEDCIPFPQNDYEITKLESEKIVKSYLVKEGIKAIILRPTNVYGEYHPFNAILSLVQFLNSKKYILLSRKARVNYVYVKDLCYSIIYCVENNEFDNDILNIGSSNKLDEFVLELTKLLKIKVKIIYIPQFLIKFLEFLKIKKLRPLTNAIEYDSRKFQKITKTLNNRGLEKTITFFSSKKMIK